MHYIKAHNNGEPTRRLKTLLPRTINPEKLTNQELADRGVKRCTLTRDTMQWWQTQGEEARDMTSDPVTIHYPAVASDLDTVKAIAKQRIEAQRDEKMIEPIEFMANQFQTRNQDRENIIGAALDAVIWNQTGGSAESINWGGYEPFAFINLNNQPIPLTASQMIDFAQAVKARHAMLIFKARDLKNAVDAASTVDEVLQVEWV